MIRLPFLYALACVALILACGGDSAPTPSPSLAPSELPIVKVIFQNDLDEQVELLVEVADTPEERARGLMFRESLAEDRGMIFVWDSDTTTGFWMKNTTIPLSIAFIEGEGEVIHIQDLEPLSQELQYSPEPYLFAVEVTQGWFERHGVHVGSAMRLAQELE